MRVCSQMTDKWDIDYQYIVSYIQEGKKYLD